MVSGENQLKEPGPIRELWAQAAVRECFRAGDLLSEWIEANLDADTDTVRTAKRAALELQRAAKPALGADGHPAHRLSMDDRIEVLRTIGVSAARLILESTPPSDRTEAEALLTELLAGGSAVFDTQNRLQLAALSQVGPMAAAAGAPVKVAPEAIRQHLDTLDFLNLIGGPDLHRFVGRADHLASLGEVWNSRASGFVLVEAPGGMGKSLLISRFVADLLRTPPARPTAVFHIDFDRRDMQNARPTTILSEMLRQAARWVKSEKREVARHLAAAAQWSFEEDLHGQSRGLEAMGFLDDHRIRGLIELLDADGEFRVIIIADSAEQVFGFNDLAVDSPGIAAADLSSALTVYRPHTRAQILVIWGARCFPPDWTHKQEVRLQIPLSVLGAHDAKAYLRAEAAGAHASVADEVLDEVIQAVGCSPLALRLAARLLAGEEARVNPRTWVEAVRNDPERIQATLHDRILKRLRSPDLRKLALPGLLLRRLTPAVIEQVLAGPCKLNLVKVTSDQLITESAREGQLFIRDVSDPDPRAVWHRPDVRALMLPDLDATIDTELAAAINAAAVAFYAARDGEVSRAEELYHRLRLDQSHKELMPRWTDAAGERLRRTLGEFPANARDFLRSRLGAASLTELDAQGKSAEAPTPTADAGRLAELRRVVRRELQRGAPPLDTLKRYNVDYLGSELGDVYAEALVTSGQVSRLLAEARDLLDRAGASQPGVSAAVFSTTAGVLEGLGKLNEALHYWNEVRELSSNPKSEEAVLVERGGVIGWLRTRRKLELVEHRETELERLALWAEENISILVSRPVLLRELVAELGDALSQPFTAALTTCQRLLDVLFEAEEAFPSALADSQRLRILSQRMGLGVVSSPRELGILALKAIYSGGEYPQRVVAQLREEVEWTLAKAVSQTKTASQAPNRRPERSI